MMIVETPLPSLGEQALTYAEAGFQEFRLHTSHNPVSPPTPFL